MLLEFGGHMPRPDDSQAVAATIERQVAGPRYQALLRSVLAIVVVMSISAVILVAPIDYETLGAYGYVGVFIVTLITTGAFVLPVPYLALIFKAGTYLDPITVALVAGAAAALGELTGYLLGYTGRDLLPSTRWERAAERWMQRHGFLSISVFAFIPNPVFDAAGIAAGALRYAIWKFAMACFVGKTAKFILVAGFGAQF